MVQRLPDPIRTYLVDNYPLMGSEPNYSPMVERMFADAGRNQSRLFRQFRPLEERRVWLRLQVLKLSILQARRLMLSCRHVKANLPKSSPMLWQLIPISVYLDDYLCCDNIAVHDIRHFSETW